MKKKREYVEEPDERGQSVGYSSLIETTRRSVIKQLSGASAAVGASGVFTERVRATPEKGGGVEGASSATLSNDHVTVSVNNNGTWQINTNDGRPLTFPSAGTSGLTVQLDGTNYTYGAPSGTSLSSYRTQDTQFSDNDTEATTKWDVNGVVVTQTVSLSGEAAVFDLEVENTTGQDREINVRWLFDYQVGEQDGAPVFVDGEVLTTETRYELPDFDSWQTYNQLPDPNLTGQGGISETPTKIEFVAWEDANSTGYEYDGFDPSKSFYTEGADTSPASDSAGLLYYDLGTVESGSTESIRTSYGVGAPATDRLEDVERALADFQNAATEALTTMVNQRARAHAAIYSRVGEEYADNYVNYFGYKAGVDGISRDDVNAEIRQKLDELVGDLESSQYGHLHDFFDAMFGAVDADADQSTMESVFTDFIEGVADEQENGSAPRLQVAGKSINDIRSEFESEFEDRRATAVDTLERESLSEAEIEAISGYLDDKEAKLTDRATTIEAKVDKAISKISDGETGRVHGKRVELDDSSSSGSVEGQALVTSSAIMLSAKWVGVTYGALSLSQLYYSTLGATSTAASISGAYSGSQLASSLAWSLPAMSYWSVLQSANAAAPSLTTVAKGVLTERILQEMGLTPSQVIEEYTGINLDILLGLRTPVTTLVSFQVDQIQEAGADLFKTVEIVDIDAPNVDTGDISPNGEATATATVTIENTSSEAITPVLINSESGVRTEPLLPEFLGQTDLGSTVIEADLPEIPAGETVEDIEVTYTFPANWLVGAYELKLTVSPTPVEGGEEATATDSFLTADVPDSLSTTTVLDGNISQGSSQQATYNPQSDTERLTFNLSYPGSNLDLHLYDDSDNHVGIDYQTGEFENEIPGVTASGPDRAGAVGESIRVADPDEEYESEVIAVDTDDEEPFEVGATDVPSLPPMVTVYTPTSPSVESGSEADTSLTVEEAGGSQGLTNVTFSVTDLDADGGGSIPAENVTFSRSGFDVPAGDFETVEITVNVPDATDGTYSGEIQILSAETSSSTPLTVSVSGGSDSLSVNREFSQTTAEPGERVTVTVETTAPASRVSLNETFDPGFETASIEDVLVDGSSVDPAVAAANGEGVVVTLNGLSEGESIVVEYSVILPEGVENGETFSLGGEFIAGGTNRTIATDTIQIAEGPFDGVVADYNADGDDDIDITELGQAGTDYANGDIDITELGEVAQTYANTSGN